jgi:formyltetrahydrofolate-dependent phosphoribosylglycinamide formyltransferase
MKNIVVLVSGGGTNLQRIIDTIKSGEIPNAKVSLVVADRDCYGLQRAENEKIKNKLIPRGKNFCELLEKEIPENTDLIVLAGFLSIITKDFCEKFKGKIINIHPSLLPKYGGKGMYGSNVHKAVVENKEKETGITVHYVNENYDEGNIIFPKSDNNVIYADIKRGKDVIRVYNMHLQSIKISPDVSDISNDIDNVNQEKSQLIYTRISKGFRQQQEQAEIFKENIKECKSPIIICGDMNNSPFSYVYRNIKGKLKDCFEEAGKGFGATYKFRYYPARIDYIFADGIMKVKKFESFPDFENSDHYPIMARLSME